VAAEVRKRRKGYTRLSSKFQVSIPKAAAEAAGLQAGDELRVEVRGAGRLMVTRATSPVEELAELGERLGIHYPSDYLDELRAEWD
jgi:AbrB family looped-hinge helix DNA binding protein